MTNTAPLIDALHGRFDRWVWSSGLTPAVIGKAIERDLVTTPVYHSDHDRLRSEAYVESQPFPVVFLWEKDLELALVEIPSPVAEPDWHEVLHGLGEPDKILERGRGPWPGGEQRLHLGRGLTVFDSGNLGFQAVWLYAPVDADAYPSATGALKNKRRFR